MTQRDDQVAEHATDNDEDQGQAMGNVQESIIAGRTWRNLYKPRWLTTNMIMAYTPSVVEEAILTTYMEAEISSEFQMWKDGMIEEMSSLHKNDT